MHSFLKLSGIAAVAMFGFIALAGSGPRAFAQAQPPAKEKKVKDQGEYDLFNAVAKETDAEKKLKLLDQWREKYPDSDFKDERLQYYNTVSHPEKVVAVGGEMLSKDPANATALYLVTLNITKLTPPNAEQLAIGEKAAQGLLANLDKVFAPEKKPAKTSDAEWKKARTDVEALANGALLWMAMVPGAQAFQKKDYAAAEQEYTKVLQKYPNSAQAAYQLGTSIIYQKNLEKYPRALYMIARAAALDPSQGGLPEAGRKEVDAYLTRVYTNFHGQDPEGLAKLKELAKTNVMPPADFTIKSSAQIAAEKEEEFRTKNPQLALWLGIKKELAGQNGDQYFEGTLKGAAVPKLKGTVISAKPPVNSKELLIGIEKADVAEVNLKLDAAVRGKVKPGCVIEWEGVPASFTKEPFLLTFDVEKASVTGLETEAPPPVKKVVPKKTGAKKK